MMAVRRSSLLGFGLFILAACGQVSGNAPSKSQDPVVAKTTSQALIADDQKYTGEDLQDHELALTFDDGPGPMEVSGALAQWLHDHVNAKTGQAQPIRTTFFVLGSCIGDTTLGDDPNKNQACDEPTPNADAVLQKEVSLGHWIANHTTTHRSMIDVVEGDEPGDLIEELSEDDNFISKYLVWNRMFFRAPMGDWNSDDFDEIKGSAMNKYVGPIYWDEGGGAGGASPVTADLAADWACWEGPNGDGSGKKYSTRQCGDRYIKEIRANGNRGIVLMHDAKGDTSNHDLDVVPGNTFDMLKYVISQLETDDTPWVYKRLDEVPSIAAVLPACDASCVECSGPGATQCTSCTPDKHVDATGACVAGAPTGDGGVSDPGQTSTNTSSGGSDQTASSGGESSGSSPGAANTDGGTGSAAASKGGCNTTGSSSDGVAFGVLAALGLAISRRSKRRRT